MKRAIMLLVALTACLVWLGPRRDRLVVGPEEATTMADSGASGLTSEHCKGWTPNTEVGIEYRARVDEILLNKDPVQRPMEFCGVLGEWLERDFEGALSYLREMPRGNEYTEGLRMALEQLESRDPERAVGLMVELVTRHEEMHLYNHVFAGLVSDSPSTAVRLVEQVPEGEARSNAIRAVASVWSQADTESALNWAANLLTESEKELAVESVLLARAADDPRGAIEAAREYLRGESLKNVMERVERGLNRG